MDSANGFPPGHQHHSHRHPHHHHHHHHHRHHCRHQHHHIYYVSPNCHLHRSILQPNNHSPACSFSTSYPQTQTLEPLASIPSDPQLSFPDINPNETFDHASMMQNEIENLELDENEDPIFVLTDEWREFFAKSEAKRRQAKKQAKN